MLLNPLTFHSPTSIDETVKLYAELNNVKLQAGGTFLLNSLKLLKRRGTKTPENVICLRKVQDLKGISVNNDTLTIRAMTTIDELFDSPLLTDNWSVLKTVCRNISTQPIRNMATIGGNLTCRYTWTEMPAVMIGLNASMHFTGSDGPVEMQPEDFFANAAKTDLIFTHITIPRQPKVKIAYRRVKKTQFVDIPMLSMLINSEITDGRFTSIRIAVNNCVDFAQRDKKLEEFLKGKSATSEVIKQALDHMDNTIYDKRCTEYKTHMFRHCLKSALTELIH